MARKLRLPATSPRKIQRELIKLIALKLVGTELTRYYSGEPLRCDTLLYFVTKEGEQFLHQKSKR
jgi:hypothetical protein